MTKIGLTLSGGGVRGVAHLGALEALEEMGISFSVISGTSAGAIAGALYGAGYLPLEIMAIVKVTKLFSIHNQKIWGAGLFDLKPMRKVIRKYIPEDSFEALKIPLVIAATDIVKGEVRYFTEGPLAIAVSASSCVPFIFEPIKHEETIFVDGGVVNNFPVEPIVERCEQLVGIHVNGFHQKVQSIKKLDVVERSLNLLVANSVYPKADKCTIFIEPPELDKYPLFSMKHAEALYKAGYDHTMSMEREILLALK